MFKRVVWCACICCFFQICIHVFPEYKEPEVFWVTDVVWRAQGSRLFLILLTGGCADWAIWWQGTVRSGCPTRSRQASLRLQPYPRGDSVAELHVVGLGWEKGKRKKVNQKIISLLACGNGLTTNSRTMPAASSCSRVQTSLIRWNPRVTDGRRRRRALKTFIFASGSPMMWWMCWKKPLSFSLIYK